MTYQKRQPLKILLAVDGSEHAQAATSMLCDLPLPPGSLITTLSVIAPRRPYQRPALEAVLEQTHQTLQDTNLTVETELLQGHPASKIVEFAERQKPDLIVLGAKGLRATLGILLGGIAQQVVEHANQPVLVVRAPYTSLRRILLVTDGSADSQRAVEYLARFSPSSRISVQVNHVLPPPPMNEMLAKSGFLNMYTAGPSLPGDIAETIDYQEQEEERVGKELLVQTVRALEAANVQATRALLRGDAATEILAYAKEHESDLIIAGSRGLGQVKGWLLGSVSRKLVHYAGCSVLIVKGGPDT